MLGWDGNKEPASEIGADTKTGPLLSVFVIPSVQVLIAFDCSNVRLFLVLSDPIGALTTYSLLQPLLLEPEQ